MNSPAVGESLVAFPEQGPEPEEVVPALGIGIQLVPDVVVRMQTERDSHPLRLALQQPCEPALGQRIAGAREDDHQPAGVDAGELYLAGRASRDADDVIRVKDLLGKLNQEADDRRRGQLEGVAGHDHEPVLFQDLQRAPGRARRRFG